MFYLVKTPWWLKKLYPDCTWQLPSGEKNIYLTFDDGPHPVATPFVLNVLRQHNAKATFFCIGKNVVEYPEIYRQVIDQGHCVGNHTFNHLNGWKTDDVTYINNVTEAKKHIDSRLFRPPYGRATRFQLKLLTEKYGLNPIMWTVLSGDFDLEQTKEKCLANVIRKTSDGAIIVFHDSEKAFERMQFVLPKVLEHFSEKGFSFSKIDL
ncbi:MAG: polysaccharide deacetylase family protein [Chitinophagaceae bacterium]|nr:polysaccharide deacetylase family protein [Chitinophagaceae bacterium]